MRVGGKRTMGLAALLVLLAVGVAMALTGGSDRIVVGADTLGGSGGDALAATTSTATPTPVATATGLLDPAKQEPVLDKFTSKDPFEPLPSTPPSVTPVASPTPTATATAENPQSASVKISGVAVTVRAGDETPTADPVFEVASITPSGVTFELLDGMQFDDGSSSVLVGEGQLVDVTNADTDTTYRLEVIDLKYAGESTTTTTSTTHTISLLSINTQNGRSSATFKVNGTTYADKAVGAVFTTAWGQIKVVAISGDAQTVTILHGDETYVLHVGQKVEK